MNRRFWVLLGLLGLILVLVILLIDHRGFIAATNHPQPDLTRGLIGSWAFDGPEMYRTLANDRSGYRRDSTLANGQATAVGDTGQAIEFHGGTDYVDLGSDYIDTKAVTISAWVYARSHGGLGNGRILDNGSTVLKIPNTDRFAFSSDGLVTEASSEYGSFRLNTWIHVVVSRKSSGVANFYINGVLSGPANQKSGAPAVGIGHVSIGNGTPSQRTDVGWDGLIDEVLLYNRVLTADEIKRLYDMGNRQTKYLSSR
jgi:hypothetical protein